MRPTAIKNILFWGWLIFMMSEAVYAQKTIRGQVKGADGETMIGASVEARPSRKGAVTDLNGRFEFTPAEGDRSILISYIGMQPLSLPIDDRNSYNITLQEASTAINEVVVTAYGGLSRRKDLVGSYEQVSAEDLQAQRPVESFDKLLSGLAAGVQVESNTGEPGLPVRIRVRGEGSLIRQGAQDLVSSGQPLFVVDGVPLYDISESNSTQTQFSEVGEQRLNPLSLFNPEDIETITILKDASATAIYGANAANGVILITTKKGGKEGSRVEFNIVQGFSDLIDPIRFLNGPEYTELYRETLFNSGGDPSLARDTGIDTDWFDLVSRRGSNTKADLSISGNNERGSFRFSAGYFGQETVSLANDFERFTTSMALNQKLSERINFSSTINVGYSVKNAFNTFGVSSFPPTESPFNEDGTFNNGGFFLNLANPLAAAEQNENQNRSFSANGNVRIGIKLFEGVNLESVLGADMYQNKQRRFNSALNGSGRTTNGSLVTADRSNLRWININRLSATRNFGIHKLSFNGGLELQKRRTNLIRVTGNNFPYDGLRQFFTLAREDISAASSDFLDAQVSLFTQINYQYDFRYYLSVSGRRDATSLFGGDVNTENFASIGGAWTLSEEPLLKRLNNLPFIKLRSTYGVTGNSRIGSYSARGLYRLNTNVSYGGLLGAAPFAAPNPDLGWERNYKFNLALDIWFGNDDLNITVEYYNNLIIDAISTTLVPAESGFDRISANAADMVNRGLEVSLRTIRKIGEHIRWNGSINFALNRNEVIRTALDRPPMSSAQAAGIVVGQDVNAIFGVVFAGVDPYNGKPLWALPDGSITDNPVIGNAIENRQVIGNRTPLFFGGITNTVSYKNWSFSMINTYTYGSDILINEFAMTDGRQISFLNQSSNQLDRWQQAGDVTDTPKPHVSNFPARNNTRYLFSNNHIGFDNVMLSYQFNRELLSRVRISNLSIYLQGTNLGYIYTSKSPADRNGIREFRFTFPQSRTFTFGVRVSV